MVSAVGGAAAAALVWIGLLLFLPVPGDDSVISEIVPPSVSEVQ